MTLALSLGCNCWTDHDTFLGQFVSVRLSNNFLPHSKRTKSIISTMFLSNRVKKHKASGEHVPFNLLLSIHTVHIIYIIYSMCTVLSCEMLWTLFSVPLVDGFSNSRAVRRGEAVWRTWACVDHSRRLAPRLGRSRKSRNSQWLALYNLRTVFCQTHWGLQTHASWNSLGHLGYDPWKRTTCSRKWRCEERHAWEVSCCAERIQKRCFVSTRALLLGARTLLATKGVATSTRSQGRY